jgi:actin-related protein 2
LKNSSSKGAEINVIDPPSRKYNVFIGAAFVAKITNELDKSWISKEDYQEKGARVIEQLTYNVR